MLAYPVAFQDANFKKRLAWRRNDSEGVHRQWIPYGMPRLNKNFANMTFFVYGTDPKTGNRVGPCGTGVFIGVERDGHWLIRDIYAVTAQHVLGSGSSIRLNTKDGESRFIDIEPHEWEFIPKGNDVAAVDVTERINADVDEISCVVPAMLAMPDFIKNYEVGPGENGFMLGLFANHPGKNRNLVAARFGHISLLAEDNEPLLQPNGYSHPSHIYEMGSRTGFSGSPVFIYRTPDDDLRDITYGPITGPGLYAGSAAFQPIALSEWRQRHEDNQARENTFIRLLGIHVGQFNDLVPARKSRKATQENDDAVLRDGDALRLPSSMTLVVPSWCITNLLNKDVFQRQRRIREKAMKKQDEQSNDATPESLEPNSAESSDENPRHKEDFTGLINAAAKKK